MDAVAVSGIVAAGALFTWAAFELLVLWPRSPRRRCYYRFEDGRRCIHRPDHNLSTEPHEGGR